jgi:hypothetical protein
MERAADDSLRPLGVRLPCSVAGVVGELDDCVEPRVDSLDPGEAGVEDQARRDIAATDGGREPRRGREAEIVRHAGTVTRPMSSYCTVPRRELS